MGPNARPYFLRSWTKEAEFSYRVAGKMCESGDILIEEAGLPQVESGDLLLIPFTGAYNHSMASNYNMTRRPAVVFVKGGNTRLAVRRDTYGLIKLICDNIE